MTKSDYLKSKAPASILGQHDKENRGAQLPGRVVPNTELQPEKLTKICRKK